MYYSNKANHCRVDFFKESGKWYTTEVIVFRVEDYDSTLLQVAFKHALMDTFGDSYSGMTAVCLDPCHKFAHPVSFYWKGKRS